MGSEIRAELMPLYAVSEADAKLFIEWMQIQQNDETIVMVPLHSVFMLESLARNPNLTDSQLVLALNSIDKKIQQVMQDSGMAETFFQTNSERFADICERHGWIKTLYDPAKQEWLMKKRANIDWTKLLEAENACNDQPSS